MLQKHPLFYLGAFAEQSDVGQHCTIETIQLMFNLLSVNAGELYAETI